MSKLCLFDLDGTLTDPKEGIVKSVEYALNSFGIQVGDIDKLTEFIGPPLRDSFRKHYSFTESEIERAVSKYREYYTETGIYENIIYEGITEMLECLKAEGVSMAIATSKPTIYAERIAEHFNLLQFFDFIAGSELDGARSRKGEVIRYALDVMDHERKKPAVIIGDREHDIIGGQENGIGTIGVTWGYGSRIELEEAKAEKIVDSPNEICRVVLDNKR